GRAEHAANQITKRRAVGNSGSGECFVARGAEVGFVSASGVGRLSESGERRRAMKTKAVLRRRGRVAVAAVSPLQSSSESTSVALPTPTSSPDDQQQQHLSDDQQQPQQQPQPASRAGMSAGLPPPPLATAGEPTAATAMKAT
ncbi:unnamed protein product, partial [Ectocarpus sp. 12 AP-2014]